MALTKRVMREVQERDGVWCEPGVGRHDCSFRAGGKKGKSRLDPSRGRCDSAEGLMDLHKRQLFSCKLSGTAGYGLIARLNVLRRAYFFYM